jgi:predicted NBD/HSP70 family sugar kinase
LTEGDDAAWYPLSGSQAMSIDPAKGSPETLRRHNRQILLRHLLDAAPRPLSRKQIADRSGLTGTAVSRIARELLDAELITEGNTFGISGKAGRRHVGLAIANRGAFVIGVGLAANEQAVSISNMRGDTLYRDQLKLPSFDDPVSVLRIVAEKVQHLIQDHSIDRRRILGVGISVAGIVDHSEGVVIDSPNLNWHRVEIKREIETRLNLPCHVESHPNALNMAEHWIGITRAARNVVLVNVALGIGGSVILDGNLVRGEGNRAGRIGHVHVANGKLLCSCGKTGCLDTVASGQALLNQLGMGSKSWPVRTNGEGDADRLDTLLDRSAAGDTDVSAALHDAGKQLGHALNTVTAVAAPAVVVLAGPMAQNPEYAAGVRATLDLHSSEEATIGVLTSEMPRDSAGVWLALNQFVYTDTFKLEAFS